MRPLLQDANQVGFVTSSAGKNQTVLDNAITIKPRRQMSVQFSGGEPTMSPYFLDAVPVPREVGYNSVSSGDQRPRVRQEPGKFAKAAAEAGLAMRISSSTASVMPPTRIAASATSSTLRCRPSRTSDNGVDIVPVGDDRPTASNNEQVGRIIEFALDNPRRSISFRSSRCLYGSDEEVTPERGGAALYAVAPGARREKPDGP